MPINIQLNSQGTLYSRVYDLKPIVLVGTSMLKVKTRMVPREMEWTYSGNPRNSTRDAIRFELGDTDRNAPLLSDPEIEYALEIEKDLNGAIARCCEALVAKFTREADYTLGPKQVAASQRAEAFRKLAKEFRSKSNVGFYVGGVSQSEGKSDAKDSDFKPPIFNKGFMKNRGGM